MQDAICSCLDKPLDEVVVPHQLMTNLNALLPKGDEKYRTISKTAMLWRMLARSIKVVSQWEVESKGSYETAVKGCSACEVGLVRNLVAEVAVNLGLDVGAIFNDYEKFSTTSISAH